jgi:uncharacterized protein
MVNTDREEIDYQDAEQTQVAQYEGDDGVEAGSLLRRVAFSLRFGDINPLISDYITEDSRVVYVRDVVDRVQTIAPFLHADTDPYPVVLDGKVIWVVDLYTTTSRYPYAQEADTDQLRPGSGLDHDFNYVRNSVKATVDAYDGTVRLYEMPGDDPILDAYRKAFPELFSDYEDMPDGLDDHLRYPEDLFRVQTAAYARYHLTDPDDFYNQDDTWRVARDPGTAGADPTTAVTNEAGQATGEITAPRIAPYYQVLQLPDEEGNVAEEAEMVLMRPFVPYSDDDQRQQLTAFMAARMNANNYGELVVYEMPTSDLPDGPGIAASTIQANETVSELENLLGRGGSEVRYGNLLLLPIDQALLYVQPFYVVAEGEARELPLLERVIVVFGDDVVIEDTLAEALVRLFPGQRADTQEQPDEDADGEVPAEGETDTPSGTPDEQAAALLTEASGLFDEAQTALTEGDLGTYQERVEEGQRLVSEAIDLLEGGTSESSSETPEDEESTDTTPADSAQASATPA